MKSLLALFVILRGLGVTLPHTRGAEPAPRDDFERFEKAFVWKVSPALIAARNANQNFGLNFDEARVKPYVLPEVLTLTNGEPVTTVDVWERQRRKALLTLFQSDIYGVAPPKPEHLTFRIPNSPTLNMTTSP